MKFMNLPIQCFLSLTSFRNQEEQNHKNVANLVKNMKKCDLFELFPQNEKYCLHKCENSQSQKHPNSKENLKSFIFCK